jgi:uncharacterized protein (DUF1501 family)
MNHEILFSRRLFLNRGVQLLSAAATLPVFLDRSAHCLAADFAANPQGVGRPDDKILVVIQLAGGNDGLNTVIPFRSDDYHRARPTLKVAPNAALKLNDEWGVHPAASGFKKLWDAGDLSIVHAVGYPNPNRSHFRSTDIWTTAEPERVGTTGWLGRYCDACCSGTDPGTNAPQSKRASKSTAGGVQSASAADPATAIALDQEPPAALTGQKYIPLTFRAPESMTYRGGRSGAFERLNAGETMPDHGMEAKMSGPSHPGQTEGFLERSALNARVYAERIRSISSSIANKANYPGTALGADLKLVAQLISSNLPTRVYYVKLGGFDTHADQLRRHPLLLEELSGGLAAFVADLKLMGHFNRTTVMTFSEFGRRVNENGSGTDHGEAAPMFLTGGAIKPGLHGKFPSLAAQNLHRGDVPFTTDFRKVYATLLKQWLGADDAKILGGKFEPMDIYKA